MATTVSAYGKPGFPEGGKARIADRAMLEIFLRTGEYDDKLRPGQIEYGDTVATVANVVWYLGSKPVYRLEGVPGLWLDGCLVEP